MKVAVKESVFWDALTFSLAFGKIRLHPANLAMRLPRWSREVQVRIRIPDENSKMTHPYLYVHSRYGNVPWIPTQVEMFSREWEVIWFED